MSTTASPRVADFVRALALAWKNLAAYPAGHPALAGALDEATRRLDDVRGTESDVTFGIVADGLIHDGEKIDTEHARKFAYALYTARVALLTFDFAVDASQLERFLRTLGVGTLRNSRVALWDELAAAGVTTIELKPVDYSGVQITDSLDAIVETAPQRGTLWEEIVRALLGGKHAGGAAGDVQSVDELSALIVKTLDAARVDAEFDANATFGVKLMTRVPDTGGVEAIESRLGDSIRLYVAGSSGPEKRVAVQQTLQILRGLPEDLRAMLFRSMLDALASDDGADSLLAEISQKISRDYVLDALRNLDQSHFASHAMLLLRSLSGVAPQHAARSENTPDVDLVRIFGNEDIDRFNPPDHQALLESTTVNLPNLPAKMMTVERLGDRVESIADAELDRVLCETLFMLVERHGDRRPPSSLFARIEAVLRRQLLTGRFKDALVTIQRLRAIEKDATFHPVIRENAQLSMERLADPEVIASLLASIARAPERSPEMQSVVEALGNAATHALLVALTEEENRSRRRRLYDFAISLGPAIVPEARTFLRDERWFVVRNMIVLLREVRDRTSVRDIRRCADHPDLRVRLQAIKTLLTYDSALPRTLLDRAINDPDPKLAETAMMLAANYGIQEAVDPLLRIVSERDLLGIRKQTRMNAIRALGELADTRALEAMQQFFNDSFLPWPPRDERRLAFESLAGYQSDARLPILEKGLKSRDPIVREICLKLKGAEA